MASWPQEQWRTLLKSAKENFPGGYLGFFASITATILAAKYLHCSYELSKTKKKIQKRKGKAQQSIERMRKRVGNKEYDATITDFPFSELHSKLQSGELSASEVLLAFQAKAVQVNDELNCITEFIEVAEQRAAQLDEIDAKERGPLHGVPVSLKEAVGVKGSDCTAGLACFIDEIYTEDSVLLKLLIKQGAVPFARTNLSQAQMSLACHNPIYGETRNPVQQNRTSGGSTGGEGALIGAGGSFLGVGCDMAGSIRIPAHFCGIVGVKVTPQRLSNAGNFPIGRYIITLAEVYGPLGREVDAVVTFLRATLHPDMYKLDPVLPYVPWREEIYLSSKPLRIGFYTTNGILDPVPAVTRAVLMAKQTLEEMGHKVIEYAPPDILYAYENLFLSIFMGDNGQETNEIMKNDIVDPNLKSFLYLYKLPWCVRWLISKLVPFTHPAEKCAIQARTPRNILDWWKKNEEKEKYIRRVVSEWQRLELDALICPVMPFPAWPLGVEDYDFVGSTYTMIYNVLNFPCGAVPATHVQPQDLEAMKNYPAKTAVDKYVHKVSACSEGMPIGVQCVALPFQEELLLRVMKELETKFKQ